MDDICSDEVEPLELKPGKVTPAQPPKAPAPVPIATPPSATQSVPKPVSAPTRQPAVVPKPVAAPVAVPADKPKAPAPAPAPPPKSPDGDMFGASSADEDSHSDAEASKPVATPAVTLSGDEKLLYPEIFEELAGDEDTVSVSQVHGMLGDATGLFKDEIEQYTEFAYDLVGLPQGSPLDLNLFVVLMRLLVLADCEYDIDEVELPELCAATMKDGTVYPVLQLADIDGGAADAGSAEEEEDPDERYRQMFDAKDKKGKGSIKLKYAVRVLKCVKGIDDDTAEQIMKKCNQLYGRSERKKKKSVDRMFFTSIMHLIAHVQSGGAVTDIKTLGQLRLMTLPVVEFNET